MKKLLLMTSFLLSLASLSRAQTSACNTFTGTTGLSEYDPNDKITYSVSGNELTINFAGAVLWGSNEVKWDFPATINLSAATMTGIVGFDISVSVSPALAVTGGGCTAGTNYLPLGFGFYDANGDYSEGFSTTASVTETDQTYVHRVANFTGSWQSADNTAITGISIKPADPGNNCTSGTSVVTGQIKIKNFAVNTTSCAAAAVNLASNISTTRLYPNPVSDKATVSFELKSASPVKVTLSDAMGKEVMTLAEGTFTELTKEFSVAHLNKGIYSVNYYLHNEAVKTELLMVK